MGLRDRIKAAVAELDVRARPWVEKGPWHRRAYEFLLFGLKEAWACLFGGTMLALLVGTHLFWPAHAPIARYDLLVIAALAVQAGLHALKLEHWAEARVIFVFHVVGTIMELFKTAHGSWIYPEPSVLRIGGVPLFSGFMYACVGSYIARAWRLFDFRFTRQTSLVTSLPIDGNALSGIPGDSFKAFATYLFPPASPLSGLTIGGGVRYAGSSFADDENTVRNPTVTLFDALIAYDFAALDPKYKGFRAQVNAFNIFDRDYYTCQSGFCYRGAPATVIGSLIYRW